jgi:hypothetical protein
MASRELCGAWVGAVFATEAVPAVRSASRIICGAIATGTPVATLPLIGMCRSRFAGHDRGARVGGTRVRGDGE